MAMGKCVDDLVSVVVTGELLLGRGKGNSDACYGSWFVRCL